MSTSDPEYVDELNVDVTPGKFHWFLAWAMLLWGLGYAALVAEAFFLFKPEDFDRLVTAGMILPGYSDYVQHLPPWVIAVSLFKAATRIGGAIGLLLRKSWAITMYLLSLASVCIIFFRGFLRENIASVESSSQISFEAVFFVLSLFVVVYSVRAALRGVLR